MDNDLPKDSFFRIDKEYGNIQRTHDLTSKIIALSQTDETQINNDASISNNGSNIIDAQISESTCEFCYKICKSVGGKKNHLKSCKEKVNMQNKESVQQRQIQLTKQKTFHCKLISVHANNIFGVT